MLFVGDDWAEDHHDVEVQDEHGRAIRAARLPEGVDGMTRIHELVARFLPDDAKPSDVLVCIETDRGAVGEGAGRGRLPGLRGEPETGRPASGGHVGIDQYQVRTWTAWQHTITVCMFAHAFVAVQHAGLHRDTTTSTDTGDQATSPGKAAAQRQPARQVPTG